MFSEKRGGNRIWEVFEKFQVPLWTDASPILRSTFNKNSPIRGRHEDELHPVTIESALHLPDIINSHIVLLCKRFWFTSLKEEKECQDFFLSFYFFKVLSKFLHQWAVAVNQLSARVTHHHLQLCRISHFQA